VVRGPLVFAHGHTVTFNGGHPPDCFAKARSVRSINRQGRHHIHTIRRWGLCDDSEAQDQHGGDVRRSHGKTRP